MVGDALEDVGEVGVRVDAVHLAGDDQALEDADVLGAELGPAKEPVLAAHRDGAQRNPAPDTTPFSYRLPGYNVVLLPLTGGRWRNQETTLFLPVFLAS